MPKKNLKKTILVIEDEPDIRDLLEYNLIKAGFHVYLAADGEEGISQAKSRLPHLILLDLMLPKMSGFDVCRELKNHEATKAIPILMVTAKSEEHDTVSGLDLGADDYIIKPFRTAELLARVSAHLRRSELNKQPSKFVGDGELITQGPLALHPKKHIIYLNKEPLILTLSEFKLLSALIVSPGQVFSRADLIRVMVDKNITLVERNIDVHVLSLRKKLGDHSHLIQTIRGVGYKCKEIED